MQNVGGGNVVTSGGTGSFVDDTGAWASRGTAAAAGSMASWAGTAIHRLDQVGGRCAILFRGSSTMTSIRCWIGWFSTAQADSDTITGSGVGLRYSTVAGDAGFTVISRDGTTQTPGANLGSVAFDQVAMLELIRVSSTSVTLRLTVGGVTTSAAVTATLPAPTTALQWEARVIAQAASLRNIRLAQVVGNTGGV